MLPHHCKLSYWATSSSPSCVISPIVSLSPLLSYSPHTCTKNSTISVSTGQSPSTARWCQLKFSSTMRSSSKFNGCLLDPLPGKDSNPTIRKGPLSQLTATCLLGRETYNVTACLLPSQMENQSLISFLQWTENQSLKGRFNDTKPIYLNIN